MEKQYRRPGKNRQNRELFSGLAIEKAGETYTGEMCRYPVILVTLKSAKQRTYKNAMACPGDSLAGEFARHENQVKGKLNPADWEKFMDIRERRGREEDYLTGLATDTDMKAPLCVQTLENVARAYPGIRGAFIHSDRGSRYTSRLYRDAVCQYGIRRYFISYWNNRRICSSDGGLPPMIKRQRYYDSLKEAAQDAKSLRKMCQLILTKSLF